jgi:hypothetical protein
LEELNSQLSSESGTCHLEIVQQMYVIPATLDNAAQDELQRYENNNKDLNLITTALDRNVYDRVCYLEIAHNV